MAKKSIKIRELKRRVIYLSEKVKRLEIKTQIKNSKTIEEKFALSKKIQKLSRNSSLSRITTRCSISGRSNGFLRMFGVSRIIIRQLVHDCFLPGVTKSSW